jgi:uncharacterized protein (UPF0333 family)
MNNNKGQTSVEYVLMIAVVITMLMSVMDIVKTSILGDSKNCQPQSKAIICTFERAFNFQDLRYFSIRR